MTSVIDPCTSVTAWSFSAAGASVALNTWPDFCAGGQAASLVFNFPAGAAGQYAQETVAFNLADGSTPFTEIVLSCLSVRQNVRNAVPNGLPATHGFDQQGDYLYQVDFGDGRTYLIPTWDTFTHVTIPVALFGTTAVSRIRITYLGSLQDYFVLSYVVANREDFPADILSGVQVGLQAAFMQAFANGLPIGTCTGAAGDTQITLAGSYAFLQRYAVVLISDGAASETHQLSDVNGAVGQLDSTYGGGTLQFAHTGAQVYVQVPIQIARTEQEPPLPGVVVWCQEAAPVYLGTDYDQLQQCWCSGGSATNGPAIITEGRHEKWLLQIDASGVQGQPQAMAATVIRWWLSKHVVWINGAKCEFTWVDRPEAIEPTEPVQLIPKTQYTVEIEVREDVWLIPTPPAVAGTSGQQVVVQETLSLP